MAEKNNGFEKSFILIVVIIIIVTVAGASYYYKTSAQNAAMLTNSTSTQGGMNVTVTSAGNMTGNTSTATGQSNMSIIQNATTQNYKLSLVIGPPAQMLSMNETATATAGEVLVRGQMVNTTGTNMTNVYLLEVHVYNLTSGAVVDNKNVTIQIMSTATNQTQNVPAAVMYDMAIGPSDTHFGNNITLIPGDYTVTVNVSGETATFHFTIRQQ